MFGRACNGVRSAHLLVARRRRSFVLFLIWSSPYRCLESLDGNGKEGIGCRQSLLAIAVARPRQLRPGFYKDPHLVVFFCLLSLPQVT